MKHEDNPSSIKYYVKKYIKSNANFLKDKFVIDFPAGNGITTKLLKEVGAKPYPLDLFPEYFKISDIECVEADIDIGLPIEDKKADVFICQEGIEHFCNQYGALKEFNRVLKKDGILLITTPNYSNLRSKLSYLFSESERFNSIMPPNELDSIWMSNKDGKNNFYFGHVFLIGIQKLRTLAHLSGFKIKKIHSTKLKTTSFVLFIFLYPFILFFNYIAYLKNIKKNNDFDIATKRRVYGEIFKISISPKILLSGNLMVEFTKDREVDDFLKYTKSKHKTFGET